MERCRELRRTKARAGVRSKNGRNVRKLRKAKIAKIERSPVPSATRATISTSAQKATAKVKTNVSAELPLRMNEIYVVNQEMTMPKIND